MFLTTTTVHSLKTHTHTVWNKQSLKSKTILHSWRPILNIKHQFCPQILMNPAHWTFKIRVRFGDINRFHPVASIHNADVYFSCWCCLLKVRNDGEKTRFLSLILNSSKYWRSGTVGRVGCHPKAKAAGLIFKGPLAEAYTAVYCYRALFSEVAKTAWASGRKTWSLDGGSYSVSRCVRPWIIFCLIEFKRTVGSWRRYALYWVPI